MVNTNVLGHLLTHMDILSMALAPNPDANFACIEAIRGFDGDITETTLDTHVNHHHSTIKEQGKVCYVELDSGVGCRAVWEVRTGKEYPGYIKIVLLSKYMVDRG